MKALTIICLILFSMTAIGQSNEKVYTWTDAEGVTHYSKDAPEGTEAELISLDEQGSLSIIGTEETNAEMVGDDSQTESVKSEP
jgi:hypothetical protein